MRVRETTYKETYIPPTQIINSSKPACFSFSGFVTPLAVAAGAVAVPLLRCSTPLFPTCRISSGLSPAVPLSRASSVEATSSACWWWMGGCLRRAIVYVVIAFSSFDSLVDSYWGIEGATLGEEKSGIGNWWAGGEGREAVGFYYGIRR
jgi:hypothetical protein